MEGVVVGTDRGRECRGTDARGGGPVRRRLAGDPGTRAAWSRSPASSTSSWDGGTQAHAAAAHTASSLCLSGAALGARTRTAPPPHRTAPRESCGVCTRVSLETLVRSREADKYDKEIDILGLGGCGLVLIQDASGCLYVS